VRRREKFVQQPANRRLCRPHSQRRKARRHAGPAPAGETGAYGQKAGLGCQISEPLHVDGGPAVGASSFSRQGSPRFFQLRDGVIGDGVSLLFSQPFLQATDDLSGAPQCEGNCPSAEVRSANRYGGQHRQQDRRRGAEEVEAREEIPHVSKRTTNWIDSNVEILFMALLVKVIGDIVEDERPRQIGTLDCSRAGVSIGRPSDVPAAAEGGALRDGTWNDRVLTPRPI
jgi:hypothetical protein